jgi:hypothetical protein
MDLLKKPKPTGSCNVCVTPTNRQEALNHRCDRVVNGRRCSGLVKSAVNSLWDQCEACQATGKSGIRSCSECAGFGWRLYA